MNTENKHWIESEETAHQRIEQVQALREQAGKVGLKFEAFLPTDLALWVLDMVEQGVFLDPSEAVFVLMGQAKDLEPHNDLKKEILERSLGKAMEGPFLSSEEVFANLKERPKNRGEAAVWKKIDHSKTAPEDMDL